MGCIKGGPTATGKSTNEILRFNKTCFRQFMCQTIIWEAFWPLVSKETTATLAGGSRWHFTPAVRMSCLLVLVLKWAEIEMCQCQMNKRSESERSRGQLQPNTDGMRAEQRSDLEDDITQFYDDVVTLILKSQSSWKLENLESLHLKVFGLFIKAFCIDIHTVDQWGSCSHSVFGI